MSAHLSHNVDFLYLQMPVVTLPNVSCELGIRRLQSHYHTCIPASFLTMLSKTVSQPIFKIVCNIMLISTAWSFHPVRPACVTDINTRLHSLESAY